MKDEARYVRGMYKMQKNERFESKWRANLFVDRITCGDASAWEYSVKLIQNDQHVSNERKHT